MIPALPAIGDGFGVERENDRQLVVILFMLGFGLGQLLWGPIAGYFARGQGEALKIVPLVKEPKTTRTAFWISMAVRPGETEWKNTVNQLLQDHAGTTADATRLCFLQADPTGKFVVGGSATETDSTGRFVVFRLKNEEGYGFGIAEVRV